MNELALVNFRSAGMARRKGRAVEALRKYRIAVRFWCRQDPAELSEKEERLLATAHRWIVRLYYEGKYGAQGEDEPHPSSA